VLSLKGATFAKWRDGRRQENSVVWVISGTQRVVGAVGNVMGDKGREQQGKLGQMGVLKRA
jgi:hypothetical protein